MRLAHAITGVLRERSGGERKETITWHGGGEGAKWRLLTRRISRLAAAENKLFPRARPSFALDGWMNEWMNACLYVGREKLDCSWSNIRMCVYVELSFVKFKIKEKTKKRDAWRGRIILGRDRKKENCVKFSRKSCRIESNPS